MHGSQLRREVLRFFLLFAALVAVALLIDAVLHVFDAVATPLQRTTFIAISA